MASGSGNCLPSWPASEIAGDLRTQNGQREWALGFGLRLRLGLGFGFGFGRLALVRVMT